MAKELTPVSQFVTVTCPEGGDPRTAASVEAGLQDLVDCTKYLKDRTPGAAAFYHFDVPLGAPNAVFSKPSFNLVQDSTTTPFHYTQLPTSTDWVAKITEVKIWFVPANASRSGNAPASQPKLQLWRQPKGVVAASAVMVGSVTLAASNEASYEVAQELTLTVGGGGHTVDSDSNYHVVFEGESGANSATGLQITRLQFTIIPQ